MKTPLIAWSEKASDDLRKIKAYIAYDKPMAAIEFIRQIKIKAEKMARHPKAGRIVPELGRPDTREIFAGNYRIIYKVSRKKISILTVFEGHRNWKGVLDNF